MTEPIPADTQKQICELISQNPGIIVSKLAELLNLNMNIIENHLLELEKKKAVVFLEQDGSRRYFIEAPKAGILDKRLFQTRKRLYDLIADNPGLHLSKIADILGLRLSLIEYHLQTMEKENLVTSVKDVGYYKRYYLVGSVVGTQERTIVSLLREDIPLQIVLYLLKHPNAKHKEILKNFKVTPSTLSYHLNKLVKYGVIDIPLASDEKGYVIKNRDEILGILKKYRLYSLTKGFTDLWEDLRFQ
jgi:predicted transcriptional regulator